MKVLFSLIALSISLALCNGACTTHPKNAEMKDGKLVVPEGCVDPYNGEKHELGATWNTIDCLKCECMKEEVDCCLRYPAVASFPGCAVTLDSEKCSYIVHEIGDPSKSCTPQS